MAGAVCVALIFHRFSGTFANNNQVLQQPGGTIHARLCLILVTLTGGTHSVYVKLGLTTSRGLTAPSTEV